MKTILPQDLKSTFKNFPGPESYGYQPIHDTIVSIYQLKRDSIGNEEGFWEKIDLLDIHRDEKVWTFVQELVTEANKKNLFNIFQQGLINRASELGFSCDTVDFDIPILIAPNLDEKIIIFRVFK